MYESDYDKVKLKFTRNTVIGCNGSKALVTMDSYNSVIADIHNYLVGFGGTLMMVMDDWREDHYENEETTKTI